MRREEDADAGIFLPTSFPAREIEHMEAPNRIESERQRPACILAKPGRKRKRTGK